MNFVIFILPTLCYYPKKDKREKMCGIAGFIDFNKKSNLSILKEMTDILNHRGPDDSGYKMINQKEALIGMGHKRLSILDLSKKGHQPMRYENLIITYNGEIYNFKEIRKELQKEGYSFFSNSDTEVILKSFHRWGIDESIKRFIGMFSFVIYDKKNQKIYCVRDRAGVKPFYYYYKDNIFIFSSELKSLHKHPKFQKKISKNALASYFKYGYILSPYSIFENTFKLSPSTYLTIDLKTKKFEFKKYWNHIDFYNKEKLDISEKEAIKESEKILQSAFEYRMVADVDVGVFLSGGYDSTCVTALLKKNHSKIKTFTIGFHEKDFNEASFAKKYAKILNTEHHELYINPKDTIDMLEDIPFIYDEPFADNSIFPTVMVSKFAKNYVNVALSADGGDEIFGGYTKYRDILSIKKKLNIIKATDKLLFNKFIPLLKSDSLKKAIFALPAGNFKNRYNKLQDILDFKNEDQICERINSILSDQEIRYLINNRFSLKTNFNNLKYLNNQNDIISKAMAIDYLTYMSDNILVKVDRASMSVSLEAREPFLDHRILEFVSKLPISIKYKNNTLKYIIKEIVHQYIPKELINRPKRGFSIPLREWYEDTLKDIFKEAINKKDIEKYGILNYEAVKEIIKRYKKGESYMMIPIWQIFIFQLWSKRWL